MEHKYIESETGMLSTKAYLHHPQAVLPKKVVCCIITLMDIVQYIKGKLKISNNIFVIEITEEMFTGKVLAAIHSSVCDNNTSLSAEFVRFAWQIVSNIFQDFARSLAAMHNVTLVGKNYYITKRSCDVKCQSRRPT